MAVDEEVTTVEAPDAINIKTDQDETSIEEVVAEDMSQTPPQPLSTRLSQLKDVSQNSGESKDNVESATDSGFVFWSELHLRYNNSSTNKKTKEVKYQCPYQTCKQSFTTPLSYTQHITGQHMSNKFKNRTDVNSNEKRPQLKCDHCDKTFRTEPVLKTHLMTHLTDNTDVLNTVQRHMIHTFKYTTDSHF